MKNKQVLGSLLLLLTALHAAHLLHHLKGVAAHEQGDKAHNNHTADTQTGHLAATHAAAVLKILTFSSSVKFHGLIALF